MHTECCRCLFCICLSLCFFDTESWSQPLAVDFFPRFALLGRTCYLYVWEIVPMITWMILKLMGTKKRFGEVPASGSLLLMEEILHHLGCIKPRNGIFTISTGDRRISSTKRTTRYHTTISSKFVGWTLRGGRIRYISDMQLIGGSAYISKYLPEGWFA